MTIELIITMGWWLLGIGLLIAVVSLVADEFLDAMGLDSLSVGSFVVTTGAGFVLIGNVMNNPITVILLSVAISMILALLVHFYITPMRKTDASMTASIESLKGATGRVVTEVPEDGIGEVLLNTGLGVQNRPAKSYDGTKIEEGTKVLVMDIQNNVFLVSEIHEQG